MPREGFSPVQSSAYLHDSDFFVRRKSDLLRYLVLAALGNFGIGGIFTVGLAVRCAKGDGVWRRFATNLLHHHTTTTSTNFHRSKQGLCAGAKPVPPSCRQPTKAGIWRRRWCAGAVLAKVPLISRLESRPTTTCGSRWEDETLKIGATRQGLRWSAGTSTSCVMSGVTQAAVAGHVSHDVAFTKSWPTGATT